MGLVLERQVERGRRTEAVSGRSKACYSLSLESLYDLVNHGFPRVRTVSGTPLRDVEVGIVHGHYGIADHNIRDDGPETISRKVIGEELGTVSLGVGLLCSRRNVLDY